jgi:hypothetical protein
MSNNKDYQLPDGIEMPERFAKSLSTQIWFFDGVQTAINKHPPLDDYELRIGKGERIANAYKAGYDAGKNYLMQQPSDNESKSVGVSKTSRDDPKKTWFVLGVEDALSNRPPINESHLRKQHGSGAASEYKAGYELGEKE